MSILLTPGCHTFLRLSVRSTSPCFFPSFKVFPLLLLLWLSSAPQLPHLCDHILPIGLVLVPYPVRADPNWSRLFDVYPCHRYVSYICLKNFVRVPCIVPVAYRPIFLYSAPVFCCPFDTDRYAIFCYPCDSSSL
jgi:hypothetical protein